MKARIGAHRLLDLAGPEVGLVGVQCLNDELILAGRLAAAEAQALVRRDEGLQAGDLADRRAQFTQRLVKRRALVLVLQLDKHRAVVERAACVAADDRHHMVDGRVLP